MSEEFDSFDDMEGLSLQQKLEMEDLIIDAAFRNSFKIITGKETLESLMDNKSEDSNAAKAICAHEPGVDPSTETLENMMAYFVETEEYEKCAEIRDILNQRLINEELKEIIPNVHL